MDSPRVIVVGAGLGGLATALRLQHQGAKVTVLEKTNQVGGRNREVRVGDCRFDGGPTLLMMLNPLRKLFSDVGERVEDHLQLELLDPSYRVFYRDGSRLDASPDADKTASELSRVCSAEDAEAFRKLLADLKAMYEDAIPNFVRKNFRSPLDFFGTKQFGMLFRHRMLANMARRVEQTFGSDKARMLFSFQTMYLGLSPYEAPWVYAVLTYMEYGEGIWFPKGGVVEVCRSVASLAELKGVEIRLGTEVCRVDGKSVFLEDGQRLDADVVVMNADLPYAEHRLMGQKENAKRTYSCSALMLYLDYEGSLPDLLHHNVFFGSDFKGNMEDLFTRRRTPEDPAFYACLSNRTDKTLSPDGHENLYLLIPCPNLDAPFGEAEFEALRDGAYRRLADEVGFEPARVRAAERFTPHDWRDVLNLDKGAAFGLSHHFRQSALFRPSNRSKANPDLYFVGASTVPGNGLPMVLISAELLEDRLLHEGIIPNRAG